MLKYKAELTLKQFEVLEDVLSEIEEFRVYEGEDDEALQELKKTFDYSVYCRFEKLCEGREGERD